MNSGCCRLIVWCRIWSLQLCSLPFVSSAHAYVAASVDFIRIIEIFYIVVYAVVAGRGVEFTHNWYDFYSRIILLIIIV